MPRHSSRDFCLIGKEETSPGVAATLNPALHAIRCAEKPSFSDDASEIKNTAIAQAYGEQKSAIVMKAMKLDVSFYMRSGGGLGVLPDFAPMLACADHNVVATNLVNVLVSPTSAKSTSRKTATFDWYDNGVVRHFVGAKASSFTMEAQMDGSYLAKVTLIAPYSAPVAVVLPTNRAFQTSDMIVLSPSDIVTQAGASIAVGGFSFDSSLSASEVRKIGFEEIHTDDRPAPTVQFSKASLAFVADHTLLTAATEVAFVSTSGSAGNRVTLSMPTCQFLSINSKAEGSLMDDDCSLKALGYDSAYSITID